VNQNVPIGLHDHESLTIFKSRARSTLIPDVADACDDDGPLIGEAAAKGFQGLIEDGSLKDGNLIHRQTCLLRIVFPRLYPLTRGEYLDLIDYRVASQPVLLLEAETSSRIN
jgi:hypothetical protein